jgi:membrane-associated phospholipid phosphatase
MNRVRIDKEYLIGIETSDLASVLAISLGILILILISSKKIKNKIAKTFSNIFNGYITVILPIIFAIVSSNIQTIFKVVIPILIVFTTISVFLVLKKMGKVSDFDMTDRKERPLYFVIATVLLGLFYLVTLKLKDTMLSTIALNTLITSTVFTVITFFWKISGHMTFLTMTYCSFVYMIPSPFTILLFPIIPFVAWSRVQLKKHTVWQVIAGVLVASLVSILLFTIK